MALCETARHTTWSYYIVSLVSWCHVYISSDILQLLMAVMSECSALVYIPKLALAHLGLRVNGLGFRD
jgi:hypothetical protein